LEREPDKANQNLKAIRANIAHKERARKIKDGRWSWSRLAPVSWP
jgi:hypothetical protein